MTVHHIFVCSPNTKEANQKLLEVFQDLAQEEGAGQYVPPIMQPKRLYFHDCVCYSSRSSCAQVPRQRASCPQSSRFTRTAHI